VSVVSVVLAAVPIGLAASRTVPSAVRLGARRDPVAVQSRLARSIFREHLFCFASIATLLVVQLVWA
jgi:NADH:ubiquinone oxidoreductase subunit 6 (subunit J)